MFKGRPACCLLTQGHGFLSDSEMLPRKIPKGQFSVSFFSYELKEVGKNASVVVFLKKLSNIIYQSFCKYEALVQTTACLAKSCFLLF